MLASTLCLHHSLFIPKGASAHATVLCLNHSLLILKGDLTHARNSRKRTAGNHPCSGKMACSRQRGEAANLRNFPSLSLHTIIKSLGRVQGKQNSKARTLNADGSKRLPRTPNSPTAFRSAKHGLQPWSKTNLTHSPRRVKSLLQVHTYDIQTARCASVSIIIHKLKSVSYTHLTLPTIYSV